MGNRQLNDRAKRKRLDAGLGTFKRHSLATQKEHGPNPRFATKLVADVTIDKPEHRALTDAIVGPAPRVPSGNASGLSRDYGKVGKRGAFLATKCYGNGTRIGPVVTRESQMVTFLTALSQPWPIIRKA